MWYNQSENLLKPSLTIGSPKPRKLISDAKESHSDVKSRSRGSGGEESAKLAKLENVSSGIELAEDPKAQDKGDLETSGVEKEHDDISLKMHEASSDVSKPSSDNAAIEEAEVVAKEDSDNSMEVDDECSESDNHIQVTDTSS